MKQDALQSAIWLRNILFWTKSTPQAHVLCEILDPTQIKQRYCENLINSHWLKLKERRLHSKKSKKQYTHFQTFWWLQRPISECICLQYCTLQYTLVFGVFRVFNEINTNFSWLFGGQKEHFQNVYGYSIVLYRILLIRAPLPAVYLHLFWNVIVRRLNLLTNFSNECCWTLYPSFVANYVIH